MSNRNFTGSRDTRLHSPNVRSLNIDPLAGPSLLEVSTADFARRTQGPVSLKRRRPVRFHPCASFKHGSENFRPIPVH